MKTIRLSDYRPPDFWIPEVELHFTLGVDGGDKTIVRSKLFIKRNQTGGKAGAPLVLNGEKLKLLSVAIDDRKLLNDQFNLGETELTIPDLPDTCHVSLVVEIEPEKNLSCEGLYKTGGLYCTQCEAESFRRITYFLDRPDVMSTF